MALPHPLSALLAGALSFTALAPAAEASPLRVVTDALSATVDKQTNPKTSVVGDSVAATLRNLREAVTPAADPACADLETSKPFARWGDLADYVPVPNSGFEDGLDDWSAVGFVRHTADNNPFYISGRETDRHSVTIGEGSSITSASFCGGVQYPTIRMMTRSATGRPATAAVTVRYTGRDGLVAALPLGTVTAGSSWGPSEITLTGSGLPLVTGTKLGLTITGLSGTIAVDDVYVDPYRRT